LHLLSNPRLCIRITPQRRILWTVVECLTSHILSLSYDLKLRSHAAPHW